MLEWLIIGLIIALTLLWFNFQRQRPCSGCEGCNKTGCNIRKQASQEVHSDETQNT